MKIRLFSDIHNEILSYKQMEEFEIPRMPDDLETILVLAGDIDSGKNAVQYCAQYANRFRAVLFVAGNHELWGSNIDYFYEDFVTYTTDRNVFLLQNNSIIIDDVMFSGATLWTDFNKNDPLTILDWKSTIADSRKICQGYKFDRLTADRVLSEHRVSRIFFENAGRNKPAAVRKHVAISHHSPSFANTNLTVTNRRNDSYYHSELHDIIPDFDLWLFGHTHYPVDHMLGDTRVVSNPVGYFFDQCKDFNPNKIISI